uniref:Si:dkey-48p11.3 n=1 Tax=Gouania willdenowi TaxID=441366 RepID=A0A8C5GG48_GOUWI
MYGGCSSSPAAGPGSIPGLGPFAACHYLLSLIPFLSSNCLSEKLLLKPKAASSLQTERVPRSNMLARLQTFLPQMAEANEKLRLQMEETPAEHFDIERVEEGQRVIEMDVGVFQLDGSDSDCEEDTSDSDSDEDVSVKITEQNLKLPGHKAKKKVDIQVLEQQQ